jgi:predicted PurR-regulated permease PerM
MAQGIELERDRPGLLDERVPSAPRRVVALTPRTVVLLWAALVGIAGGLWFVWHARHVIAWILVAAFLAVALDPAVRWLQRHGVRRRGTATGLVFAAALLAIGVLAAVLLPTLIGQVSRFVNAIPSYVHDLTSGRGPLGFLETRYHIVEHTRQAVGGGSGTKVAGGATTLLNVTKGIAQGVAGAVTIGFMTFFMLLEGPRLIERAFDLVPPDRERRWRTVGADVYRVIGGYVSGNLLLSLIAATSSTIVLLAVGVPFPLALGLLVFVLDLIPLAGATLAAVVLTLVALSVSSTAAIVVLVFFIVYQQIENHVLQPLVYGRTVQVSPLFALIAVLLGAAVGGVLGALAAIPVAGMIRVVAAHWMERRLTFPATSAG